MTNLFAIPAAITYSYKGIYGTSKPTNKISIKGANMENATVFMPRMEMTGTTFIFYPLQKTVILLWKGYA